MLPQAKAATGEKAIIRPNKNRPTSDLVKRPVSPARRDKQSSTRPTARRLALLELFRANVHCWLTVHSDGAEYSRRVGASQDLARVDVTKSSARWAVPCCT